MTLRAFAVLLFAAVCGLLGLAFGHRVYFLVCFALLLVFAFSLVSILALKATLRLETVLKEKQVKRGSRIHAAVSVTQRSPFPTGSCTLTILKGRETEETPFRIRLFRDDMMDCTLSADHVGQFSYGALLLTVTDFFSLFRISVRPAEVPQALVLPNPFEIEKPRFVVSDEGKNALSRAQEDTSSPEDVRGYAAGDPMKRIHWKLSARKRELLVRRYETPEPPDTLILMDCQIPVSAAADPAGRDTLRDLMCETCCAVASQQLKDHSPVRVPFYGKRPGEFTADDPARLLHLEQMLAMQPFEEHDAFEKILRMELRRMRRTGAVIILTTRLTPSAVEEMIGLKKMGPSMRVYYVSLKVDEEELLPCVTRLQHHMAEVCYVTPA